MTNKLSIADIVLTGLVITLIYIAGSIIKIPSLGGFVHIGDCMVFLSAVILGTKKGTFAAAVGMALVDVLGGYIFWTPFTFIIKGGMAFIVGTIIQKSNNTNYKIYTIAFLMAGIFMIIGYFFAGIIVAYLITENVTTIMAGVIYSSKDIIGNIIQVIVGIIIALPLAKVAIIMQRNRYN